MMKLTGALLILVAVAGCNSHVPPYVLTAPSPVDTPAPTPPPVPPPLAPLTVDVRVGPSSPRIFAPAGFTATTHNLDGAGIYTWVFGDGDTMITTTNLAPHTYQTAGIRLASVRVTEASGRFADATIQITVRPEAEGPAPTPTPTPGPPSLSATMTCTVATSRSLEARCNLTTRYSGSPQPVVVTRVDWDFGDGKKLTVYDSPVVTHPYAQAGSYTIFANVWATTVDGERTTTATDSVEIP